MLKNRLRELFGILTSKFTLSNFLYSLVSVVLGIVLVNLVFEILHSVEQPDLGLLGHVIVYGAFLDEVLKFSVAFILFKITKKAFLAGFVGFGYGLGEQLLHVFIGSFIAFKPLAMHTVAGIISAYFLTKYKTSFSRRDFTFALIVPMIFHSLYNFCIWLWYMSV